MTDALEAALAAEGCEPCKECLRADECASGLARMAFSKWVNSTKTVYPAWWRVSRRHHFQEFTPTKEIYQQIYGLR